MSAPRKPVFRAAVATNVGNVRTNNEDSYHYDVRRGLFIVSDGMGGHAGGEVASALTVDAVAASLEHASGDMRQDVLAAIRTANDAVNEEGRQSPGLKGLGATVVMGAAGGWNLFVAHVGDSRAYMFGDGRFGRITKDHKRGQYLDQAIGQARVRPDITAIEMRPGDVFLLCSDGLTDMVNDDGIRHVMQSTSTENLQANCYRLIDAALMLGGVDNVTIVMFIPEVR